MESGEIGKLPTGVNIPAAHLCNQGTSKRMMRVVNVIMVGGSRFFCLAPCLCLEQLQFGCCGAKMWWCWPHPQDRLELQVLTSHQADGRSQLSAAS